MASRFPAVVYPPTPSGVNVTLALIEGFGMNPPNFELLVAVTLIVKLPFSPTVNVTSRELGVQPPLVRQESELLLKRIPFPLATICTRD